MIGASRPAGSDHRHIDAIGDRARELDVVAGASPITIDAREEDLTGAAAYALRRPRHRVATGAATTSMGVDLPPLAPSLRVDTRDHALGAEQRRGLGQPLRTLHRRRIDAHLVRAGAEHAPDVIRRADAAADG